MSIRNILIMVALVAFLGVETLNYGGFCYADRKFRSDADYMRAAIELRIASAPDGDIIYDSADEFVRLNPHCCVFSRWVTFYGGSQVLSRLFGFYAQAGLLYRQRESGPEPYYMAEITLDACGRHVDSLGESLSPTAYRDYLRHWAEEESSL